MTRTMRAVVMTGTGGPETLQMQQVPLAWPCGDRDVLVRLKCAGLNPADAFFRALGTYLEGAGPCILGSDGAGVVEEIGVAVSRFKPGDAVCFCNGGIGGDPGTYAEFAVVCEEQLAAKAANVSFAEAAALPLVAITAWESLYDRAQLRSGEHTLIHAGAGGTGHVAIQLAMLRGAHVAATVSTDIKADFVKSLGVERPILYRQEKLVDAALDWTGGEGLAVALDNVGPEAMQETYRAMAPYGRIVTLMGTPADDDDLTAYNRNLTIHNVMMLTPMWFGLRGRLAEQARLVAAGMRLLEEGKLKLHIDSTFPLSDVGVAHAKLEAGGMLGKMVLHIAD